jgi:Cdc6-like AAA superfamily ATPase
MLYLISLIAKQNKVKYETKNFTNFFFTFYFKAVLLIGKQGTAKTVLIKHYMSKLNTDIQIQKS